jgi:hypothetical protein
LAERRLDACLDCVRVRWGDVRAVIYRYLQSEITAYRFYVLSGERTQKVMN